MNLYSNRLKTILGIVMFISLAAGTYFGVRVAIAWDLVGVGIVQGDKVVGEYENTQKCIKTLAGEVRNVLELQYQRYLKGSVGYESKALYYITMPKDYNLSFLDIEELDAFSFNDANYSVTHTIWLNNLSSDATEQLEEMEKTGKKIPYTMANGEYAWKGLGAEYITASRTDIIQLIQQYGSYHVNEKMYKYQTSTITWEYYEDSQHLKYANSNTNGQRMNVSNYENDGIPGMLYYDLSVIKEDMISREAYLTTEFYSKSDIIACVLNSIYDSYEYDVKIDEINAKAKNWHYNVTQGSERNWKDRNSSFIEKQPIYWIYDTTKAVTEIETNMPKHLSKLLYEELFIEQGTKDKDSMEYAEYIDKSGAVVSISLDNAFGYQDVLKEEADLYKNQSTVLLGVDKELYVLVLCMVVFIGAFVLLLLTVGYQNPQCELTTWNTSYRVPTELMLLLPVFVFVLLWILSNTYMIPLSSTNLPMRIGGYTAFLTVEGGTLVLVILEFVSRKRNHKIFEKSILVALFHSVLAEPIRKLGSAFSDEITVGIQEIEKGNLEYQIDTSKLYGKKKKMAESINNMQNGLKIAVEQSMKDERLKTELITNVSHDIKTPLTSIINYVDLLKKEDIPGENAKHYLDVLEQKSQRLKQLMEDLIEASKAATGNLHCEPEQIDLVELLRQTFGEFNDKFTSRKLQLIDNFGKETVMVNLDSRHTFRIFENLCQNAFKYSMPQSRIYVDLQVNEDNVTVFMKNVSEEPLNITPEELTERFVRGDKSRNSSGSGLGLSIVKNLVLLQKGEFDIMLDGDLFKIKVTLPKDMEEVD